MTVAAVECRAFEGVAYAFCIARAFKELDYLCMFALRVDICQLLILGIFNGELAGGGLKCRVIARDISFGNRRAE